MKNPLIFLGHKNLGAMKKIYSFNFLVRVIFLLITPVFFQYFALGFIFHSVFWGVITFVVVVWGALIVLSPLLGRVGCGWFCFMGTASDLASQHSIFKNKWKKPKLWLRLLSLFLFFSTAIMFYFLNTTKGLTHDFEFIPGFVKLSFNEHYQFIWIIDISLALLLGLFFERRSACRNFCIMGSLCSAGAHYSRLLAVVDTTKCTLCGKCEKECLVRLPMVDYIKNNKGLITNSECILCGKCIEVCEQNAITFKFVWNRGNYKNNTPDVLNMIRERNKVKKEISK